MRRTGGLRTWPKVIVIIVLLALVAGAGSYFAWRGGPKTQASRNQDIAVPVSVAKPTRKNVPIYLVGLGTAQATYTIGIHSQVDGKLQDVLFKEGQHVKKGEILAKIDPRLFQATLDQAKAKKAQDEANLVALQKDLSRFQALNAKGFETQQNIDQQLAKVNSTKATIEADTAAVEFAQTQLDYTDIRAPSDGRMGVRLVDPGNIVHASDQNSIAVLVLTQPIAVLFTLPADTLDSVRDAQKRGTVQVDAFDRDNRRLLSSGTLTTIDNQIDQTSASYRLKASFPNEDEKLWPGEFVNARLLVDTETNALTVPNTAIQRGPNGLYVWVITDKNTAVTKPVETGPMLGGITVVRSGISDGERVVTGGQYKLRANAPVSISTTTQPAEGGVS